MDLNELLSRHQVALMYADQAGDGVGGQVFAECADHYAQRIRAARPELVARCLEGA